MKYQHITALFSGLIGSIVLSACGSGSGSGSGTVTPPPNTNPFSINTLYSFGTAATDPIGANSPLIKGSDGNLYGVSSMGGANNMGAFYRVTAGGTETVLYSFGTGNYDGTQPAGLVLGTDGNFYGTTASGGTNGATSCASVSLACLPGDGTVFMITPAGIEKRLYSFGNNAGDGITPNGGMIQASNGFLYGTTSIGGTGNVGSVFKISTSGIETVIYSFGANSTLDANSPYSGLIQTSNGNFYGTAISGGKYGKGAVYQISNTGIESLLYSFGATATDGTTPYANLLQASDGNIYGTTIYGGAFGNGSVFKLTPAGAESILYSFGSSAKDGTKPYGAVIQGSDGNFYGSTYSGGANGAALCSGSTTTCPGYGTLFMITSAGTETVLYSFGSTTTDGTSPFAGLVQVNGSFYGTTNSGGKYSSGTIYSFVN